MTEVDASDKALLSDKQERGHLRTRNAIRKETQRLAIRDRRKAFFSQFMDGLSDEMLIEPLRRVAELSQSDLIDTVSSITQFTHMESFNKKLLDIQFEQHIVNLLMGTDKIEIKVDLTLALINLSYFYKVSTDRILQLKIPSFLLAEIKSTGFSNSKEKAYVRNIACLVRNLVCSSIYNDQFSSYLLDESYFSLLIGKVSDYEEKDTDYVREILDSITKTLQIIVKKKINHGSLINQCLNIFTLKENLLSQIKLKCLSGLYISFIQNIGESTLCEVFQNPDACYGIQYMLNDVDKNSQDAVYGLQTLKTLKRTLPEATIPIIIVVSQSIIDFIKSDNQTVKLAALKTFAYILQDIASNFGQNDEILQQIVKIIFQTINTSSRSNHLFLIQHIVSSFYWLRGTHILYSKDIHRLLIDILIQQQELTIDQVCRIIRSLQEFVDSQNQIQSNNVKSLINGSEALSLIKKYQQCDKNEIVKEASKLLKKL